MAEKDKNIYLPDGTFDFSKGVDSSKVTTIASSLNPNGLKRNQLAWLINGSCRDGVIRPRMGFNQLVHLIKSGHWQGGFMYEPDGANPYLVCQISGVVYSVLLDAPYTVTDLTGGNAALKNPADTEMAFFVQGDHYLVIQAGDYLTSNNPTLPLFWDGTTLRRSLGLNGNPVLSELPAAMAMDYYGNRIWYAQGRKYTAGDILGDPLSGSIGSQYRDSILHVSENPLALGGDGFSVPTNAGNIRALKHSSNINASLGQGEFFIFTRKYVFSLTVPVNRTDWINANANNQPEQRVVQIANGAVGHRCVVPVNGDLFYQSIDPAIRSLITAVRYFQQWGNIPISKNENKAIVLNDRALMRFSGGVYFDNRMYQLAMPQLANDGLNVIHLAMLPMDFDVVSSLDEQSSPVWEGACDGLQFLELFQGDFGGLSRGFAVSLSNNDSSIDIWEMVPGQRLDKMGEAENRIVWSPEFPAFNWSNAGLEFKLKQLRGGELWLDGLSGTVGIDVYYREDAAPCWRRWFYKEVCAGRCEDSPSALSAYPCEPFREGFAYPVVFPEPPASCNAMNIRPSNIGYQFQVKIMFRGYAVVRGLMLYVTPHSEPQYHGIGCAESGMPTGMRKLP